ncbi:MAG: hypothetical protein JNK53_04750, partial [Phycisphaerae bacterium]|nr:hypothetical protein [Phycisphaerae bacterium]
MARTVAWVVALGLLAFVGVWPLVGGLVASGDDIKFLRAAGLAGSAVDEMRAAWSARGSFRPLEIAVAAMSDAKTLACPPVVPIQAAGLVALAIGASLLMRRLVPSRPIAVPLLLIWIALSPA